MKKFVAILAAAATTAGIAGFASGCTWEDEGWTGETTTITAYDVNSGENTLQVVPLNAQRVAVLDYAVLDMMDVLGLTDRIVCSFTPSFEYLSDVVSELRADSGFNDLGSNLKSFSMELVQQSEPDVIFIGGRQSSYYDSLSEIATVVYLYCEAGDVVDTTLQNFNQLAAMFGKSQSEAEALLGVYDFEDRIAALRAVSGADTDSPASCYVIMFNSDTSLSNLDVTGRCSIILSEIGFENKYSAGLTTDGAHGTSFTPENYIKDNPDYVFVMNRATVTDSGNAESDAAIKSAFESYAGANAANMTSLNAEGHFVVLAHSDIWYTAEGGVQALSIMLSDLEEAFGLI